MHAFFVWHKSIRRLRERHQAGPYRRTILGAERLEGRQLLTASDGLLPLPHVVDCASQPFPSASLHACEEAMTPFVLSEMRSASSGDYRIDDLCSGYKWGASTMTFSFYAGGTYYGSESSPTPVSEAVKANVRHILNDIISPLINITFTEVTDTPTSYGVLRYLCSYASDYGYAYYPMGADTNNGSQYDVNGDVVLNPSNDIVGNDFNAKNNSFQSGPGSHGFSALIHETCHALGLKHPFESPSLPRAEENLGNTVMTYNFKGSEPATPMAYDVLALQYLYGVKTTTRANDTTYTFTAADNFSPGSGANGASTSPFARMKNTLWDAGGIDTVDLSSLTGGYRIDIQPGGWITNTSAYNGITYDSTYKTTDYGTRIPLTGTTIENVVASLSADTIYLNAAANTVSGYAPATSTGADVIYNSDQSDTLDLRLFKRTDVAQSQSGQDLVLALGGASTVTVKNYYAVADGSRILLRYKSEVVATITANRTALKAGESATITFSLSTSATNFTAGDVTVTGGVLSNFAGSGGSYTATFTPTPNFTGTATVTVAAGVYTDGAGTPNVQGSLQLPVDTAPPTLSLTRNGTGKVTTGSTATITFTLSEPSTTFTAANVTVAGGSISGFSGSGGSYTAVFTPAADYKGTASIAVARGAFTDAAGNANLTATPLLIAADTIPIPIEATSPGFGSSAANAVRIAGELGSLRIVFNVPVTGLTLSAIRLRLNNRSVSLSSARIVGSGTNYTLLLPQGVTARPGVYVVEIVSPNIVSDYARMTSVSKIYWTNQPRR